MTKKSGVLLIPVFIITLIGTYITACDKDELIPEATGIEVVSGNRQTAEVLASLTDSVVILAKDQNDEAFAGKYVHFEVEEGSVSNEMVKTDINGYASTSWTLGSTIGTQKLYATIYVNNDPIKIKFIATATAPTPVTDIDGNSYNTVVIGNQIWMAENLKVTHYPDSTPIPLIEDDDTWAALEDNDYDDAYCYNWYGAYYTYAASIGDNREHEIKVNQGVCPTGWHLPSDEEWTELKECFGVNGNTLKAASGWYDNGNGTDAFGFRALSGGFRSNLWGNFSAAGYLCYFWSVSECNFDSETKYLKLEYNSSDIIQNCYNKSLGLSIRCIKD